MKKFFPNLPVLTFCAAFVSCTLFVLLLFQCGNLQAEESAAVSLRSLLDEMCDRSALAASEPIFTCSQASSFDRNAKSPGKNWFANADASQFIRTENNNGREEWVLLDAQGPGAIVRWWITSGEYKNHFHIYIDGAQEPTFSGKIDEIVGGTAFCGTPLSQETARGRNLYLPIPYAKSIKITCDAMDVQKNLYYQINYRTYSKDTAAESFSPEVLRSAEAQIAAVCETLLNPPEVSSTVQNSKTFTASRVLEPGKSTAALSLTGPGNIVNLRVKVDTKAGKKVGKKAGISDADGASSEEVCAAAADALRSTILQISFDGQTTVLCPLGDFFGSGVGLNPYRTFFTAVAEDGNLQAFWPMPFLKDAQISFLNVGTAPVTLEVSCVQADISENRTNNASDLRYFHANWRQEREISTLAGQGTRDWNYVTIDGSGTYVGDVLSVVNSSPQWWGEGDEKIYVDGESFPSHFGTGTEDYYGYAWCTPTRFESPWRAQPRAEGPSNFGNTTNLRFRSLDRIPFEKNFRFDMEIWHWASTKINYAVTVFWYGPTSSRLQNAPSDASLLEEAAASVRYRTQLSLTYGPFRLSKIPSGNLSIQGMGSFPNGKWRDDEQLWWSAGKSGDELDFLIEIPSAAKTLTLGLTRACDYGIFEFYLDGKLLSSVPFDACNPVPGPGGVISETKMYEIGTKLQKTQDDIHHITVHLVGKSRRSTGTMFGLHFVEVK